MIPDELQLMAEEMIRSANKHGYHFRGMLFTDNPIMMMGLSNGKTENFSKELHYIADIYGRKIEGHDIIEHKVKDTM